MLALGLAAGGASPAHATRALRHAGAADSAAVRTADAAYDQKDWLQAARGYDAFTRNFAAGPRTWYRLGSAEGSLEHWPQAIAAYRAADSLGTPPQFAAYNMACAFARAGLADSAFAVLGRATDRGWGSVESLDTDADLAALKTDARFAALRERADRSENPCKYRPESRQFDFWVGEWEVFDNQHGHGRVGHSHVESILGDCVVFENWTGGTGGTGKSFNSYNAQTGAWQQNWMDNSGDVTNFEQGHFADGHLSFVARKADPTGAKWLNRLTFFDLGPERVRQFSERSDDEGKTWSVQYDFDYRRVPK
jgi:hypothetical protein